MEEFFNICLDSIFELFTNIFTFVPFQVLLIFGLVLVALLSVVYALFPRGKNK